MPESREFEPLMKAILGVLRELGEPSSLAAPLRPKVEQLQQLYDDYAKCCCFRGTVVAEDPYKGQRS